MIKPYQPPVAQEVLVNVTDHDSRVVRTHGQPPLQGYNAHMAVNEQQHAAPGESFGGRRRPVWRRGSPASMSVAVTRVG
jgi:hypothetical protein